MTHIATRKQRYLVHEAVIGGSKNGLFLLFKLPYFSRVSLRVRVIIFKNVTCFYLIWKIN